jgi:phage terminase large subunit
MATAQVLIPKKLQPVFSRPRGSVLYRGAHGGRGSGKSQTAAKMAAVFGYAEPLRILATREFQISIKDSFHAELKSAIASEPWLEAAYDVGVDYIKGIGKYNKGTEFIFRGLHRNIGSLKSLANIDLTIVEEAEDVPEDSWLALEATVFRRPKSELWPIWNPRDENSPVDKRFRKHKPAEALIVEMNWRDNPWFPPNLDALRRRQADILDSGTYGWVWEGEYLVNSDIQVMGGKWIVDDFEISEDWDGPYQGGDFGFSQDPLAAVRCYINGDYLMVSHEAYKVKLEIDDTVDYVNRHIPEFERYSTRWDNARPESISYIARHGYPRAVAVEKWPGSIEDGIAHLRGYKKIIIHPRCPNITQEMRAYSHKVDKKTNEILADIVDANNHAIDALRYAVEPMIMRRQLKYAGAL